MHQFPLVSILIPVYNRSDYLPDCIDSALNQTYKNIEIIIVDNCSTDNTWQICCNYAKKYSNIRTYLNASNVGPVKNWKIASNYASGLFGSLLFSDDLLNPNFVEESLKLFHDDVAFVYSPVNIGSIPWHGRDYYSNNGKEYLSAKQFITNTALFRSPVSPCCALFRIDQLKNNILDKLPGSCFDDFDQHGAGPDVLIYLLSTKGYSKIGITKKALVFFRVHSGSITISDKNKVLRNRYLNAICWYAIHNSCHMSLSNILTRNWYSFGLNSEISFYKFSKLVLNYSVPISFCFYCFQHSKLSLKKLIFKLSKKFIYFFSFFSKRI